MPTVAAFLLQALTDEYRAKYVMPAECFFGGVVYKVVYMHAEQVYWSGILSCTGCSIQSSLHVQSKCTDLVY